MCIKGYEGELLNKGRLLHYMRISCVDLHVLQLVVERWISVHGLTVSLESTVATPVVKRAHETADAFKERCIRGVEDDMRMKGSGLMDMIKSGAKGTIVHASHMAVAIGQQYVGGREGVFCGRSYSRGLTPHEFFGHQMAAREGVVSTGVGTAATGYLNRRACKILADLKLQYNGVVADSAMISSFQQAS